MAQIIIADKSTIEDYPFEDYNASRMPMERFTPLPTGLSLRQQYQPQPRGRGLTI
jgi:hypothetical protein